MRVILGEDSGTVSGGGPDDQVGSGCESGRVVTQRWFYGRPVLSLEGTLRRTMEMQVTRMTIVEAVIKVL